jgi:hypothetical protein
LTPSYFRKEVHGLKQTLSPQGSRALAISSGL